MLTSLRPRRAPGVTIGNGLAVVRAQVLRADGTVVDLGVVSRTRIPFWRRADRRWMRDNLKKGSA